MSPARRTPCASCRQRHPGPPSHRLGGWCVHEPAGRVPRFPARRPAHGGLRPGHPPEPADRPLLVYLFDPYCPWSYGYLPALAELLDRVGGEADLEVVNIGLYDGTRIADTTPPLVAVQRCTGVGFGPGYRRALAEGSMELSSLEAAAAVIALVAADPARVTDTLWEVHRAFFWSGSSLSQRETVARVGRRLGLDADAIALFAGSRRARELAEDDATLARDLGARRGPRLLVSHGAQLCEFEGPGSTGEHLLLQYRSVLARP